jgi:hypothetical protein
VSDASLCAPVRAAAVARTLAAALRRITSRRTRPLPRPAQAATAGMTSMTDVTAPTGLTDTRTAA